MRSASQIERAANSFSPESAEIAAAQHVRAASYRSDGPFEGNERRDGVLRWAVATVWMAVILTLGTSYFSLARTAPVIEPIIRTFAPGATAQTVYDWHVMVRWSAHFGEYAALFAALAIGPMRRRPLAALAVCIACASLDEGLQSLRSARSALMCDVALDSSGAAAAMLMLLPRLISKKA